MSKPKPYTSKIAVPLPSEDVKQAMRESYKPDVLDITKMLTGTGECFAPIGKSSRRFEAF